MPVKCEVSSVIVLKGISLFKMVHILVNKYVQYFKNLLVFKRLQFLRKNSKFYGTVFSLLQICFVHVTRTILPVAVLIKTLFLVIPSTGRY